jgi:hypothetical protein
LERGIHKANWNTGEREKKDDCEDWRLQQRIRAHFHEKGKAVHGDTYNAMPNANK